MLLGRRRKILVAALILPPALLCGLYWYFLDAHRMAGVMAARMEAAYGAPVTLRKANIGIKESSLQGLKFFELGASPSDPPWLEVDSVQTDLSMWSTMNGQADPEKLTLQAPRVTLN